MDPSFLIQQQPASAFMSSSNSTSTATTTLTALAKSLCQLCHKKIFEDTDQSVFKDIFPVRVECANCGSVYHEKCLRTFASVWNMKSFGPLKSCKVCAPSLQTESFRIVLLNNTSNNTTTTTNGGIHNNMHASMPSWTTTTNNNALGGNTDQQVTGETSPVRPEDLSCTIM